MDTLEFLEKILPPSGYYVILAECNKSKIIKQRFFNSIKELSDVCIGLDKANYNVYYAISSFLKKGKAEDGAGRLKTNVRSTKVIAIDVDCGENKPFNSWKEGLIALSNFITTTKLPRPLVVHSGRGLHVYWVLKEAISPKDWMPLASAMKQLAINKEFKIDVGVTANRTLVLRPIGTHNPKNNEQVKILLDANAIDVEILRDKLLPYTVPNELEPNELLNNLKAQSEYELANSADIVSKCNQVKWAVNNQSDVAEPLWYDLMGIAAYCLKPEETAIKWSAKHPNFDATETINKIIQWKKSATGSTTCKKFELNNPNGCKSCVFKGKIKSPTRLGIKFKETELPDDILNASAKLVPVPAPFKRTSEGIKIVIDNIDIDLCDFDLYPVSYGLDETLGYEVVRYHWNRLHIGWQELVLRQACLVDGSTEFSTSIADQGIVLYNKRKTEYFQYMLRTYMNELRKINTMTNLYNTMGWKEANTAFVLGNTLFKRDTKGNVETQKISLSSSIQSQGSELYALKGSLDDWVSLTSVLEKGNLKAHMFVLGVAFSAPLYNFTGLKGLIVSLYGPSGGGKTLAQYWAQSIYGDPDKLHFTAKYTQNSLFSRLGTYANLPMTIDEVTMMDSKDVGDFCYWVSQGRDKARLNARSEEREAKTWATPVITSTNTSMQGKLIASGLDTDAQMARLMELTVMPTPAFTKSSSIGRKIYGILNNNYGHAGIIYIKHLLSMGEGEIKDAIVEASDTFNAHYGVKFSGEERYWEQAIVLADLGLQMATELNLIQFKREEAINWVLHQIDHIRNSIQEGHMDAFDIIANYMSEYADSTVTVMYTANTNPQLDHSRIPKGDIKIRLDINRKDAVSDFCGGVMLINRTHFRKWLYTQALDYKMFKHNIIQEKAMATPKSEKASLGKNTPIKLAQVYVIGFDLAHPRFFNLLNNADTDLEKIRMSGLSIVAND